LYSPPVSPVAATGLTEKTRSFSACSAFNVRSMEVAITLPLTPPLYQRNIDSPLDFHQRSHNVTSAGCSTTKGSPIIETCFTVGIAFTLRFIAITPYRVPVYRERKRRCAYSVYDTNPDSSERSGRQAPLQEIACCRYSVAPRGPVA
jgi:hypothetical protein